MSFISPPTLYHLLTKRILVILWNTPEIKRLIESKLDAIFNENIREWEQIEEKIIENIQKLNLPKKIENGFADYLRPIGLELLAWIEFHFMHVKLKPIIPAKLFWTSDGTINLPKTAEILIKEETLDLYDRYKLACAFCLEDAISDLWQNVQQNDIKHNEYGLTLFWSHQNQGTISKLWTTETLPYTRQVIFVSPYELAFRFSVESANITATKYFFGKLNDEERKKILYIIGTALPFSKLRIYGCKWKNGGFLRKYCLDFFLFAVRDLTEEQINACRRYDEKINYFRASFPDWNFQVEYLTGFLNWPFQEILLDAASSIWSFLPPSQDENYSCFLLEILQNIIQGNSDYDYIQLFKTFWEYWPSSRGKKYTIQWWCRTWVTTDIYKFAEKNNIPRVFKDWSLIESYSDKDHKNIPYWLNSEPGLLGYYILACLCHEEVMMKYKDHYKERVSKIYNLKFPRKNPGKNLIEDIGKWYEFFECLEEFLEHEEGEKSLVRKYKCPPRKKYILKRKYH